MTVVFIGLILALVPYVNSKSVMRPKIVNGKPSNIRDYGHSACIVMLGYAKYTCGGSIINQKTILTAAHCFDYREKENMQNYLSKIIVILGHHDIYQGRSYQLKAAAIHEGYDISDVNNDIALGLLSDIIPLGIKNYRIALSKSTPKKGTFAKVAGWGITNEQGATLPETLFATEAIIMSRKDCVEIFGATIPQQAFCAGYRKSNSYPSAGDSGNALVVDGYLQVGIVSFTLANEKKSVVYTDVSQYKGWIETNARKLMCLHGRE